MDIFQLVEAWKQERVSTMMTMMGGEKDDDDIHDNYKNDPFFGGEEEEEEAGLEEAKEGQMQGGAGARAGARAPKQKKIHLINQGAYGCFYYPGLSCRGKIVRGNFGIKIHFQDETSQNEWDISQRIRTKIPGYAKFFAPLLQQCPVASDTYGNALSQCDVYNKYKKRHAAVDMAASSSSSSSSTMKPLLSSKIRYVGKSNIKEYLMRLLSSLSSSKDTNVKEDTKTIASLRRGFRRMVQTQRYAFRGLLALQKQDIVHYDIRNNNIMYDDKLENPVFIDFGLSIPVAKLSAQTYADYFYRFDFDVYLYWCFDIYLLNFISQKVDHPETTQITAAILFDRLLEAFLFRVPAVDDESAAAASTSFEQRLSGPPLTFQEPNDLFQVQIIANPMHEFREKWKTYLRPFVGKSWETLRQHLLRFWKTWDTYSLCVVYFFILEEWFTTKHSVYKTVYQTMQQPLTKYVEFLSTNIYGIPTERLSVDDCIQSLQTMI